MNADKWKIAFAILVVLEIFLLLKFYYKYNIVAEQCNGGYYRNASMTKCGLCEVNKIAPYSPGVYRDKCMDCAAGAVADIYRRQCCEYHSPVCAAGAVADIYRRQCCEYHYPVPAPVPRQSSSSPFPIPCPSSLVPRLLSPVLRSLFPVPRSLSPVLRSPFPVPRSLSPIPRSPSLAPHVKIQDNYKA